MTIRSVLHKIIDETGNEAERVLRHLELDEDEVEKDDPPADDETPKGVK